MQSTRMERISDLMVVEISKILFRKVKDPRVRHVTVMDVKVTRDLKTATVFFSLLMDDLDKNEALAGLNRAAGFIRSELFRTLRIKSVPSLTFKIDPSVEYGAHIDKLLNTAQEGKSKDEKE